MRRFRVTYMRTSYMEIDLEAEDCRDAEVRFEALAAADPIACESGEALTAPCYRIVDTQAVDRDEARLVA